MGARPGRYRDRIRRRKVWKLTDLLGRSMGSIEETSTAEFIIEPNGHALETMDSIERGPYASLDAALAQIEKHTRGVWVTIRVDKP